MADVLRLERVSKSYDNGVPIQVLHDVDLSFGEGTFNSVIGASGSGKSTLLNIMGTLDRPTSGRVIIDGVSTDTMGRAELAALRNSTIGFIFQFHHLLPEFTALENVLMPCRLAGGGVVTKAVRDRAVSLMVRMGLEGVIDNPSTRMSGGQQQRTAIARALVNNPKLVLADEPTGNLDSESSERVYDLLREVNRETGTTLVVVTHDRRIAEKADRIVEVTDGRVAMDIRVS